MTHTRKWQVIGREYRVLGYVLASTYEEACTIARHTFGRGAVVVG